MRRISLHGINVIDLDTPAMDGTLDTLSFVYRSAWEIVCEMMQDPLFLQKWTWEYKPQHNSRGERMYGDFMSGPWVELVYSQIQDPAVTVVFVVLGSDATQIKKETVCAPVVRQCRQSVHSYADDQKGLEGAWMCVQIVSRRLASRAQ